MRSLSEVAVRVAEVNSFCAEGRSQLSLVCTAASSLPRMSGRVRARIIMSLCGARSRAHLYDGQSRGLACVKTADCQIAL